MSSFWTSNRCNFMEDDSLISFSSSGFRFDENLMFFTKAPLPRTFFAHQPGQIASWARSLLGHIRCGKEQICLNDPFFDFLKLVFFHRFWYHLIGMHNISSFHGEYIIKHLCQIRTHLSIFIDMNQYKNVIKKTDSGQIIWTKCWTILPRSTTS